MVRVAIDSREEKGEEMLRPPAAAQPPFSQTALRRSTLIFISMQGCYSHSVGSLSFLTTDGNFLLIKLLAVLKPTDILS